MAKPSGGAPSAGQGSRRTGTAPPRRATSSASAGTAATSARVRAALNRTPPVVDTTAGSSLTASTAAKPTPNRPTLPSSSRLAEARSVASPWTPAASSGAPVLAARSPRPVARQFQPQPPGHAGAPRGVGGVLRELDQQPVAVAAADQVLLGVRVLPEPGRRGGPGGEHPAPDRGGAEGVGRRRRSRCMLAACLRAGPPPHPSPGATSRVSTGGGERGTCLDGHALGGDDGVASGSNRGAGDEAVTVALWQSSRLPQGFGELWCQELPSLAELAGCAPGCGGR